jgi:hypothetical protein
MQNKDFEDKLSEYLDTAFENGEEYVSKFVAALVRQARRKTVLIAMISGILAHKYHLDKGLIDSFFKDEKKIEAPVVAKPIIKRPGLTKYLAAIADRESSNDPKAVNSLGYIGKYQFGRIALTDVKDAVGIKNVDRLLRKFKRNHSVFPEHLQDKAMVALLKNNINYLGDYLNDFDGEVIKDIKITKSGLLAGAHLLGASKVKKFLDSGGEYVPEDANGTPITEYIKMFGGYDLSKLENTPS